MSTAAQQLRSVATAPAPMTSREIAEAPAIRAGFFDLQSFELIQRVSKAFASSDLVPKAYQGNLANCMIAMDMAQRLGANPLMVMQNLYIVHGTPSWSSKFLIATINACGRYSSLRYEWRGKPGEADYGCRAWAVERETGERLDGIWVDWRMVKSEGWDAKNGSKWKTMADQMFVYRAAAFWQRAYAPELGMGLQTVEDTEDMVTLVRQGDGVYGLGDEPTPQSSGLRELAEAANRPASVDQDTGEILDSTPAQIAHQPEPERIPQQTRQAEPEPVRQQQARRDEPPPVDAEWTPSAEELAEIEARERAEAGGQAEQRQAAPAGRRPRGQMNLD